MAINYIVYNGESSLDHNVYVSGNQTFDSPEKEITRVSVPGRNGDLLITTGRFKNVTLRYKAIIIPDSDYQSTVEGIRDWLLKNNGYVRLEDTYSPNEYRLASFVGPINFTTYLLQAGETELEFDCKPQRFLKTGDEDHTIIINTSGISKYEITNPTSYAALPRIRVEFSGECSITFKYKGYGTTDIWTNTVTIKPGTTSADHVIMDSDTMICTNDSNANLNKICAIGDFLTLDAGLTEVTWTGSISSIKVIPRWWRI